MAFDLSLVMVSSSPVLEVDDGFHKIRNTLSRLSICTSCVYDKEENEATKNQPGLGVFTSESFDGAEADGEVSDDGGGKENVPEWDSDKETPQFYSLPVTPTRRRRKLQVSGESFANESSRDGSKCSLRRQRRVIRGKKKKGHGFNGGSDGGVREGLTVLTRAKGGEKSLRMGLEDVKACRDLGFELDAPGRISVSTGSNFDTQTSSGSNSPIATWRISSPGDDPKEVKARLKVWAQAVALASATRQA
ncbi:unnamed protein product [Microthlaspi erraticum]|uniref:Uncharacterized protein n=1 Tax=Microthlaspi erraticum TaxID=1685480 RepID=A0A6D2IRI9_9BRAS|nr:unnamed protein product [Microthlaspi erraticum]